MANTIKGITVEINGNVGGLNGALASVSKEADKLSKKLKGIGDSITEFGTGMTKYVTTPIMAAGTAAVAAFKDVDKGEDALIKKTGATGEAAEELVGIMENLATTIPVSFEEAGNAVGEVNTRFGLTGKSCEELSSKFLKFAKLNDTNVSDSIDKVQKAMAAYNVPIEDADKLLDRLTKTSQRTGVKVDKLADGLVANGAAFQELGLSVDQAVEFMGDLEVSGADANTVLNGMRKALKNAAKEGKPLDEALGDLQSTILLGTDSMDGLTAAYELFGKSGDQIYAAVKNGTLDFRSLGTAVEEAGGTIDTTFDAMADPLDSTTTLFNQLKLIGSDIAKVMQEMLVPVLKKISEWLNKLLEKWRALTPEQQQMIIKIAAIVAAIGPLIAIGGKLISVIGGIASAISILTANPIIAVIALVVAAVVALTVVVVKNWDKIKAAWNKGTEAVKKKTSEFITNEVNNWKKFGNMIVNTTNTAWNNLKTNIMRVVNAITTGVTNGWNNIKNKVTTAVTNIKTSVTNGFNAIKTSVSTASNSINSTITERWTLIKNTVTKLSSSIKNSVVSSWSNIVSSVRTKMFNLKDSATSVFNKIKSTVEAVAIKIRDAFRFKWELPKIKLPHFKVDEEGGLNIFGIKIPRVRVEWYKKAYENPYLFNSPTVVNGRGFGDGNGGELVYGRDALMRDIAAASQGSVTINVYASDNMNVNELADKVQHRLVQLQRQRMAVYA